MCFTDFESFKKTVHFNKNNYEFGTSAESEVLGIIQTFFNDPTIIPLEDGADFDYIGDHKLVELKTRRCNRLAFNDTCIGVCKIERARKLCHKYDIYFVFKFLNGIWYHKFDPKEELLMGMINHKQHYFISTKTLIKIE